MLVAVAKPSLLGLVGCARTAAEVIQSQPEGSTSDVHTAVPSNPLPRGIYYNRQTVAAQLAAYVADVNLPQLTTQESLCFSDHQLWVPCLRPASSLMHEDV